MGRIDATNALAAADAIYPLLRDALREHGQDNPDIGAIKGEASGDDSLGSPELDTQLDAALEQIDAATLSVYLANTPRPEERTRSLRRAFEQFRSALAALEEMPAGAHEHSTWLIWHAEALKGLALVDRLQAERRTSEESV
jgi:hypothetical protein